MLLAPSLAQAQPAFLYSPDRPMCLGMVPPPGVRAFPYPWSVKTIFYRHGHQPVWSGQLLHWGSLFPEDPRPCQTGNKTNQLTQINQTNQVIGVMAQGVCPGRSKVSEKGKRERKGLEKRWHRVLRVHIQERDAPGHHTLAISWSPAKGTGGNAGISQGDLWLEAGMTSRWAGWVLYWLMLKSGRLLKHFYFYVFTGIY